VSYPVYDFRTDITNMLVTPHIRSRFMRMEPGEVASRHSHDLGHEIFLILEGQCEMEIDGDKAVLGPGQLCVALAHQMHQARNVGDGPMTMYLSVTPHISPTHTQYDKQNGERLAPRYNAADAFDQVDTTTGTSTSELADRFVSRFAELAAAAGGGTISTDDDRITAIKRAAESGDREALARAIDAVWDSVRQTYERLEAMSSAWTRLSARAAGRGNGTG
jgi:quercetin dioxygenase-like cupin family protein